MQPGMLLKGQLCATQLQTVVTRTHLTFLVQQPIPHVSIPLLQMKGITPKIESTQNCSSLIYMRQN